MGEQISRDIGIKLTTSSWHLTAHRISPEVDQDRFYLLQDLILPAPSRDSASSALNPAHVGRAASTAKNGHGVL